MPDVGEGLAEAEILKWYVQPGDTVTDGQVVCEVETAKAAVELPIPYDGVVRELHFPEGTTVDVGQVIIAVDVGGGSAPHRTAPPPWKPLWPRRPPPPPQAPVAEEPETGGPHARSSSGTGWPRPPRRRRPRKGAEAPAQQPETFPAATVIQGELNGHGSVPVGQRPLAKPRSASSPRTSASTLATITPSGPDGIITREDVHGSRTGSGPEQPAVPAVTASRFPPRPRLPLRSSRTTRRVRPVSRSRGSARPRPPR